MPILIEIQRAKPQRRLPLFDRLFGTEVPISKPAAPPKPSRLYSHRQVEIAVAIEVAEIDPFPSVFKDR
jgi:hypothetical protein